MIIIPITSMLSWIIPTNLPPLTVALGNNLKILTVSMNIRLKLLLVFYAYNYYLESTSNYTVSRLGKPVK